MARQRCSSFSVRQFCFFLTLGLVVSCVAGLPAARTESSTSDPSVEASSDDPSSLWDVFDGLDIDGNPWLSQSSPPSAITKNKRRSSSSFGDDDYDYDEYDDNLLDDDDGDSDEDGGNMFLSFPRKAMNFREKQDESDSDEEEKSSFKHNVNSLPRYSDDFSRDDENLITKTKSLGPVSVVEDEGSEEDVIFATNDDEDDDEDDESEVPIPLGEKKGALRQIDDDSDDQTFGEPELEGVESIYNDHIFLF